MSQRIFIDTQYVVALVNQRDQFHHRANDLARTYNGQPLVTTDAVFVEIGNSLSRRFRPQAIQIIDEFLTSADVEVIRVGSEVFLAALELYRSHADKSWGMTDCILFVVMRQNGLQKALTHDRHFAQAGFHALMRK